MQDKDKIVVSMYNQGLSMQKIASLIGYKSANSVKSILKKNNVQIRTKAGFKKPFKEDYFEKIDSEEKAYWLGFLTADGNVFHREKSQPCIRIELSSKDEYILENLKKELELSIDVKKSRKNCCILRWHSLKMADDLKKYGVIPNKTKKERFVILDNKELMNHYIRGFFDGDGWVTNTTSHGKRKGSRKNIGFVSNYQFLESLKQYLSDELGLNNSLKITERKGCSMLLYSSVREVTLLRDYLYNDANIFLKRKRDSMYQVYVNTEVSQ